MSNEVLLLGLPGCGQSRFAEALRVHCQKQQVQSPICIESLEVGSQTKKRVWTLIDIRSELHHDQAENYLLACLEQSSGVVFVFAESADLTTQAFWQNWLKRQGIDLPVLRWFSQTFAENWHWQSFGDEVLVNQSEFPRLSLQSMEFELGTIYLEHLLFGLDSIKQNLGAEIWRVKASVQTQEYVNPVSIEGTINRWDTYAVEQASGKLTVLGASLDKSLLTEIVEASALV
ncbi:hypothetical protein [Hydrogenovibrio marinus]|uniref:CobW C-terminal domain-containing protein n=1 Tax=Hydrogenovibrio marinus TaxID=28885 RepID=A0A067A2K8_HYDMR|nr:hypothetical protein [Hydrogenovibrio marinus]KDN96861.1 hypothetical protein EI16_11545 [Hydrogenovibrio marinus]BBN59120.1 hypothetical protein HVMH_0714 [Hydrogenovibrio marinus]